MDPDKTNPTRRFMFVDGLRGLAALAIMLPHAWELFQVTTQHPGWKANLIFNTRVYATGGVQVFFVLSGFVIAYVLRNERITPVSFGRFLLRRAIRLDPPYWVSITFSSTVLIFLAGPGHHAAAVPSLRVVLAHLFYLQDIVGYGEPIDHIYWTLCIEIQMYIAFCATIGILQAMRLPYRFVLGIGLILVMGWPVGLFRSPIQRFFLDHEYCFLAGAVAWWTIERSIPRWITIAAAGAFLSASISRDGDFQIWVTFTTAILLVAAGMRGKLSAWLSSAPFQFVGSISYGLYLVHDPIIALTLPAQRRLGLTSTTDAVFVLLFVYLASFATAYAMRLLVEIPSIRWSHQFKFQKFPKALDSISTDTDQIVGAQHH